MEIAVLVGLLAILLCAGIFIYDLRERVKLQSKINILESNVACYRRESNYWQSRVDMVYNNTKYELKTFDLNHQQNAKNIQDLYSDFIKLKKDLMINDGMIR